MVRVGGKHWSVENKVQTWKYGHESTETKVRKWEESCLSVFSALLTHECVCWGLVAIAKAWVHPCVLVMCELELRLWDCSKRCYHNPCDWARPKPRLMVPSVLSFPYFGFRTSAFSTCLNDSAPPNHHTTSWTRGSSIFLPTFFLQYPTDLRTISHNNH